MKKKFVWLVENTNSELIKKGKYMYIEVKRTLDTLILI